LLREMKHRIKNILTMVQAIAARTLRDASTEQHAAFTARLQALAGAHDLLTNESWQGAPLDEVVARALAAFLEKHSQRILISGPSSIWIKANPSLLLTMALHELLTNAIKYGALSNASGQVNVRWELRENGLRLRLIWEESGGPAV